MVRELGNATGQFFAKGGPELTEQISAPNVHVGGRQKGNQG